ncbi:MAG: hypothetical protein R3351_03965 [Nitrospirales bacterium]|nr:hypothetical protein [Nitrospirales bacterium]
MPTPSNAVVPIVTDSTPQKISSTTMIRQPVPLDEEKEDQLVRDSQALLQERLGYSSRPIGGSRKDCLSGSTSSRSGQVNSLQSRYECRQNWFQEKMGVKVAYEEQRWNNSRISNLGQVLQAFTNQNNLASSKGSLNIIDKHLKAEFDFQHSRSVNQLGFRQSLREDHNNGELSANVRLTGSQDIFRYWGEFQFIDDEFSNQWDSSPLQRGTDQKGGKVGAELNVGWLTPQIEFRQFQDNVEEDSQKPQTKNSTSRFALKVHYPAMPILTLAYERGRAEKASQAGRSVTQNSAINSYSANLWYGGSGWEVYGTTSQNFMTDNQNNNYRTNYYDHIIGGSYTFIDALTIMPSLELIQTDNPSAQYSMQQLYGNLGIYYTPPLGGLSFSFYGYYAANRDSSEWMDNRNMNIFFSVERDLPKWFNLPHKRQKLILRFDHSQYTDQIYSVANTSEDSALLLLSISP